MSQPKYRVPFSGRAHHYTREEQACVMRVMQEANPLTQGEHLREFEEHFKTYTGAQYALGVCNATAALELSAQMCQFEKGDEVIIPAHTFTSSAYPFIKAGARVVWADIEEQTRVVSAKTLEAKLSSRTRAIVVVHLYGYAVDMVPIMALARKHNILVIEDAAQALGTRVHEKHVGTLGDFGVFSFHSHKNISTLGEGGMLTMKVEEHAQVARLLRHNGHSAFVDERENYWTPAMGNVVLPKLGGKPILPSNYCLGEVEAALGSLLLQRIDSLNDEKRERALGFMDALQNYPELEFHRVPSERHNYHLLVARCRGSFRDLLMQKMSREKEIQCVVQYYPLNRYEFYRDLGLENADCPRTDEFFDHMISFPFHHWLNEDDLEYMQTSLMSCLDDIRNMSHDG